MTIVLRTISLGSLEVRVISCRHRHMIRNRITADDETTGVDTSTSHCAFKHLGIFDGVRQLRIAGCLSLLEFPYCLDSIGEVHLWRLTVNIRQTIRDGLTQSIRFGQRQFLDTGHILDGVLSSHRGIGDDMGTILVAIFILYPFEHLTTPVIVEVSIDIRE